MKKLALFITLGMLILLIGCTGGEDDKQDGQVQQKDCGVSVINSDSNAICFENEYLKCSPVKVYIVESAYNMSLSVNKGTPEACELDITPFELSGDYSAINGQKLSCVVNSAGGINGISESVKAAHAAGKCTGSEEVYSFFFGSSEPQTTS